MALPCGTPYSQLLQRGSPAAHPWQGEEGPVSGPGQGVTGTSPAAGCVGKARRRVAAELISDLERIYQRKKAADKELTELLKAAGSTLTQLNGIGPSGAMQAAIPWMVSRTRSCGFGR